MTLVAALENASHNRRQVTTTCRVLHLINGEHYSGAERVQDLLAMGLPEFHYQVGFAALKPGIFDETRRSRESAPLIESRMRNRFDRRCVQQIADFAQANGYAIVHAHTPRSLLIGRRVARRTGLPLVYHVHSPAGRDSTRNWQNRINLWFETRALRSVSRMICVSASIADYMLGLGHDREKIRVVHNGVPVVDLPHASPDSSGAWTVGTVALFRPRKGIEILLRAIARLRDMDQAVRLLAVGPFETPEYERSIRQLTASLGIDELVNWTGFCRDVQSEISRMQLFVLPSLFGEGLPMVLLEAMAAGTPVLASDVEGVRETIRHGEDGLIVPPNNVDALVAEIQKMRSGHYDWHRFSAEARLRQRQSFSQLSMSRGVAKVYDEIR